MITFDDLKRNPNGQTAFFLPMRLRIMLTNELNRQGVKLYHKLITYREIMDSPELSATYRPDQEAAFQAFSECGCEDAMSPDCYDMLLTDIEPSDLFEKLKQFYGETIDPDYAFWHKAKSQPVPVADGGDDDLAKIPVSIHKFEIIGDEDDLQKLARLMQAKHVTEQDCELILRTLRLPAFPTD